MIELFHRTTKKKKKLKIQLNKGQFTLGTLQATIWLSDNHSWP